ncbi:MAG: isochorismatase family protein [Lentisphaeria bacterium]|jgi:nicotinamidase/pyrazinamidase|nr:isochorismatase family protein [Lentisphaeria bacterium]
MNALILVDIQNDFMPGGALAKPDGRDVVPVDSRHRRAMGLTDCPREQRVTGACVYGVATDYCVKCTCLNARSEGVGTSIIVDACRGVELQIGDVTAAVDEMQSVCVNLIRGIEL